MWEAYSSLQYRDFIEADCRCTSVDIVDIDIVIGKLETPFDILFAEQWLLRCPVKTEPSLLLNTTPNSAITDLMESQLVLNIANSDLTIAFNVDTKVFIFSRRCLALRSRARLASGITFFLIFSYYEVDSLRITTEFLRYGPVGLSGAVSSANEALFPIGGLKECAFADLKF